MRTWLATSGLSDQSLTLLPLKPATHEAFSFYLFLGYMQALFAIWKPVGIEMTSLLAVFLASLLDLKDRTCSISQFGVGASRQKLLKQASCAAAFTCVRLLSFIFPIHPLLANSCFFRPRQY